MVQSPAQQKYLLSKVHPVRVFQFGHLRKLKERFFSKLCNPAANSIIPTDIYSAATFTDHNPGYQKWVSSVSHCRAG